MKFIHIIIVVVCSIMLTTEAFGDYSDLLKKIIASNGYNYNSAIAYPPNNVNYHTTRRPIRTEKPRGRSYKEICRAVNPAPYSFPNKIPFPSVPIC